MRFVGRVAGRSRVAEFVRERTPQELVFERDGVRWAVVRMFDETRPAIDIAQLATEKTPAGRLAQLLLALESDGMEALPPTVLAGLSHFDPKLWVDDEEDYPLRDRLEMTKTLIDRLLEQLVATRAIGEAV